MPMNQPRSDLHIIPVQSQESRCFQSGLSSGAGRVDRNRNKLEVSILGPLVRWIDIKDPMSI